jgi:hypothetical protein
MRRRVWDMLGNGWDKVRDFWPALLSIIIVIAIVWLVPGGGCQESPLLVSPLEIGGDWHNVYVPLVSRPATVVNPGFELGYGGDCEWYEMCAIPVTGCYREQRIPAGWTGGWRHKCPCESGVTGLPEMKLAERRVDPRRVHSGAHSAQGFTFWRCGNWWWEQTFNLAPGHYQAGAWVQTWNNGIWARVCLSDVCSPWFTSPDEWIRIVTPAAQHGGPVKLRVEFMAHRPYKNTDGYVDDVAVWRID